MDKKVDYSKIYSPSKLAMFLKCPKSYHFYYLDPIYSQMKGELKRQPVNIWGFHTLGKAVHNAITLFYHLPASRRTKEGLKEQLRKTWLSEVQWNKKPPLGKWGGFKNLEEEREAYAEALLMLKNFLKIADREPQIEYLPTEDLRRSIEDYLNLTTSLNEDFDISGKFDLIISGQDNSLHVIDFKTSKKEGVDDFQIRFYKVLAEANFKKAVKKASLYFLKKGKIKEFDLEKEETEEIKEEIIGLIEQIKTTKSFEPKPSKLCRFCLFKNFCPEKEKVNQMIKEVKEKDYSDDLPF